MKKQLLNIALLLATAGAVKAQVSFAPAVNYGTIGPNSVFSADFNGDTNMDLATASNGNNVSVLLGSSTGTFAAAVNYTSAAIPRSIYSADFNGDGKMDLVTCAQGTSIVWVHLNNGNGTFAPGVYYSVASPNYSVFSADFNGDGKMDLVTANISSSNVSVLLGNGDGTFAGAIDYAVGTNPYSVFSADFNGDGKMDLVTANYNSNNVSVLLGSSTGTFAAAVNYVTGTNPQSVFSADFNGDSKMDLVTANYNSNNVSVLLGSGTGTFAAAVNFAVGTKPQSVFSADFNGDGKMDLVTANNTSNNISVLLGSGTGAFAAAVNFAVATGPASVFSADFNADGKMDLATANPNSSNVSVLLNNTPAAALNFDGTNDFVNIPNNSSLNFGTNDFTIETYAKTSSVSGNRVMIGKINGGNNFWFGVSNGKANFSLIGGPDALGTSTIGDGNWHHLAAVRQNGVVSLYVDGVLEASQNNTGTATINANLTLGNFSGGFNFPGSLDEVRIWNRALCKGELLNNKNAELPSSQTGLVAYYNFNQGLSATNNSTVTSLNDLSGNANNGTLNNFTLNGAASNWVAPGAVISGSAAPTYSMLSASAVVSATTICANEVATVTISANGGSAAYSGVGTYTTNTAANSYTVTDVNNCAAIATVNIIVNTLPNVTVNSGAICTGQSFAITPAGANTYTYSNGTNVVTPAANASYTVTGTDINGCKNMAISSVTVDALPTLSVNNATICSGTTGTLSAITNSANTVNWYATPSSTAIIATGPNYTLNPLTTTTVYAEASAGGTKSLVTTYLNNNGSSGNMFDVNVLNSITLNSFNFNPNATGTQTIEVWYRSGSFVGFETTNAGWINAYTGTVNIAALGVASPINANIGLNLIAGSTYGIYFHSSSGVEYTNGTTLGNVYTSNADLQLKEGKGGTYFNVVNTPRVFNGELIYSKPGCTSAKVPVILSVNATPTITVNSGTICTNNNFTITPMGADTYTFSSGSDVVMPTTDATYTVSGTVSATGCSNTAVSTVTVNPLPVVFSNPGNVHTCGDVSATFGVSSAGTNTYQWYFEYTQLPNDSGLINGSYTEINFNTDTMTIQQVLTGNYNNYYVYCEVTNQYGCVSYSTNDTIWANPLPTVSVNSGVICSGQSFTIVPSGADTYTYSGGSDVVMPTADASYTVTGTDSNGCENTAVSSLTVNALPNLIAMTTNTLLCTGETATLSVMGAATYTWSTTENTSDIVVSPTVQTTYTVDGTDANGCSNTTTITQDVSLCTGVVTLSNNDALKVYPNPNKGLFTIEVTTASKVTVTNALGQEIMMETFEAGKHMVNINNESTGVYFVKVITNNSQQIIKIVKE